MSSPHLSDVQTEACREGRAGIPPALPGLVSTCRAVSEFHACLVHPPPPGSASLSGNNLMVVAETQDCDKVSDDRARHAVDPPSD